jgi:hypothetical protein
MAVYANVGKIRYVVITTSASKPRAGGLSSQNRVF